MARGRERGGWGERERASDNMMSKCHLVTHFKPLWSSRFQSIMGQGTAQLNRIGGLDISSMLFS